ncbi:hypothetical protein [Glycomyces dulcitolivorans]|uniref:hypothetical protein n=1 Tax=Glycomyces dulcitolivorans TaxID=2200759 RepID=UPI000DD2D01F|nr:hypothetical protein [Glycomyces dulcitolivorans]
MQRILDACAGLPLALAIVAARAAARPDFPLGALASDLHEASDRLDALADSDPATDLRAVFASSYQALSSGSARLFRLLSLHPGPELSLALAASIAGAALKPTQRLLTELTRANLLVEPRPGRYAFHDLLRAYAAEHGFDAHCWRLSWTLRDHLDQGSWQDQAAVWQTALEAARRLQDSDAQVRVIRLLAEAFSHTGRIEDGRALLDGALLLCQDMDERVGDQHRALTYCEHAMALMIEIGDRYGEAESIRASLAQLPLQPFDTVHARFRCLIQEMLMTFKPRGA